MVIVAYSIREDAKANTFSATELKVTNALQAHQPSVQSHHAQTFIVQGEDMEHDPLVMRDREGKDGGGEGAAHIGNGFYSLDKQFSYCFP